MKKDSRPVFRAMVEIGFIIFLFYSNLLMGEFTHSSGDQGKSLAFALKDIVTAENFSIAVVSATMGHLIFDYFRRKF